jgi:hypothetical protein
MSIRSLPNEIQRRRAALLDRLKNCKTEFYQLDPIERDLILSEEFTAAIAAELYIEELTEKLRQAANFLEDTAPPEYQDLTAAVRRAREMLAQARLQAKAASLAPAIASELYKAFERLDASPELLSIIGSYGDTLDDKEILELLRVYNETGKVLNERQ